MSHYVDRKVVKLERGERNTELSAADDFQTETMVLTTISDAGNITQRALEKRLAPLKLSVAQQRLLALVYYATESLAPSMLASLLLQESHSVSGLLNRLDDRGLTTRSYDKEDRRVIWVGLTPEGRKIAEEAIQVLLDLVREFRPIFESPNAQVALNTLGEVENRGFRLVDIRDDVRQEALRRVSR
jgi:DNA-binding MarR family transcriptional regulator